MKTIFGLFVICMIAGIVILAQNGGGTPQGIGQQHQYVTANQMNASLATQKTTLDASIAAAITAYDKTVKVNQKFSGTFTLGKSVIDTCVVTWYSGGFKDYAYCSGAKSVLYYR